MLEELRKQKLPFAELIAPFLQSTIERASISWGMLTGSALDCDFPNLDLQRSVLWIADELCSILGPALLSRFDKLRPRQMASFSAFFDESDLYNAFVTGAFGQSGRDPTFEVPVAQKAAAHVCQQFSNGLVQVLQRLQTDAGRLSRQLETASPQQSLVEVRYGLSDKHSGGATVCALTFKNGRRVIYKPRSMQGECLFYGVLRLVNEGPSIEWPCSQLAIIDRGAYSWCNFVEVGRGISVDQARRFYYRCGVLCACANLLGVTDCHDANLLACGEQPYLVDVETIGHPDPSPLLPRGSSDLERFFREGVLRTGFLPFWKPLPEGAEATLEAAALGDSRLINWRSRRLVWHGLGTDGIGAIAHTSYSKPSPNLPVGHDGQPYSPSGFIVEICEGFSHGLHAARREHAKIRELTNHVLSKNEVRFIFRDTDVYYALRAEAAAAADYIDPQIFENQIGRLRGRRSWPRSFNRVIDSEIACVLNGDIPRFTVPGSSRVCIHSGDQKIPFRFTQSPKNNVLTRLAKNASGNDLAEASFVRRTLKVLDISAPIGVVRNCPTESGTRLRKEDPLATACKIGDRLIAEAIHHAGEVGWFAPVRVAGSSKYNYRPIGEGLYEGKLGIAIFLIWLSRISGTSRYADLGQRAIASSRSVASAFRTGPPHPTDWSSALLERRAETLFCLAAMGHLTGDPQYAENALRLVTGRSEVPRSTDAGILNGYAGEILARLALYDLSNRVEFVLDAERFARAAVEQDAATLKLGLAHGEAGLGIALLKLADASGGSRYRAEAENCLLREQIEWKRLRERGHLHTRFADRNSTELSWCNGMMGMLLLGTRLYGSDALPDDLKMGIVETAAKSIHGNDTLCCGAFGHATVQRLLTNAKNPSEPDALSNLCANDTDGPWALLNSDFEVTPPGLFCGLSGIGASFLVASAPTPHISFLTFEIQLGGWRLNGDHSEHP